MAKGSKKLLIILILALIYFVSAKLGLRLAFVNASATAVWPPTGIAIASFLIFGNKIWPAIFLGAFFANVTTAGTILTSLGIATGNTLEGVIGAYLVNRFASGRFAFEKAADIFKFVFLAGIVSTIVSATIGVISLSLGGFANWADFLSVWLTWWLGDATGALIFAPIIILWSNNHQIDWSFKKIIEVLTVVPEGVPQSLNKDPKILEGAVGYWSKDKYTPSEIVEMIKKYLHH